MINFEINYDVIINVKDSRDLENGASGIYVFLDENNIPLYVGIADDFKIRVEQHIKKWTNTKRFSHHFKKVALIFEKDPLKRKVGEIYLINTLKPVLNKSSRFPDNLKGRSVTLLPGFSQCNGTTNENKRCRKNGHTNGFCFLHGGNGESLTLLREKHKKAIEEMVFKNRGVTK